MRPLGLYSDHVDDFFDSGESLGRKLFGTYEEMDNGSRVITVMYFSLTTLSTVGYGDFFP